MEKWKKIAKVGGSILLGIGATLALVYKASNSRNDFDDRISNASDDELEAEYEERRQQWEADGYGGDGEKTPEMKKIDREMSRRLGEKWEDNPNRNTDPNFRWTDENRWDRD